MKFSIYRQIMYQISETGYKPCKTTHLAAILAALETQQTSATTTISPHPERSSESRTQINLHSTTDIPTTGTATEIHLHLFLCVLSFRQSATLSKIAIYAAHYVQNRTYRLLSNDRLSGRSNGNGGLLHGQGVGVPGSGLFLLGGRFAQVGRLE